MSCRAKAGLYVRMPSRFQLSTAGGSKSARTPARARVDGRKTPIRRPERKRIRRDLLGGGVTWCGRAPFPGGGRRVLAGRVGPPGRRGPCALVLRRARGRGLAVVRRVRDRADDDGRPD